MTIRQPAAIVTGHELDQLESATRSELARRMLASGGAAAESRLNGHLTELQRTARYLQDTGRDLTLDNPAVSLLVEDSQEVMRAWGRAIQQVTPGAMSEAGEIAARSVYDMTLLGAQGGGFPGRWNQVDPATVASAFNYMANPEWTRRMAEFHTSLPNAIERLVLSGIAQGHGPRETARRIAAVAETMPRYYANNMMRTIQITSYRDAGRLHRMANAHIIDYQVRVAVLDTRVCMACVALHGTILPVDARVEDHYSGRCDSVNHVRGRPPLPIQTGEEWFGDLPPARQQYMMGGASYRAWQDGAIKLSDIPRRFNDPLFGDMVGANSLKGMIGQERAEEYYQRNLRTPDVNREA